MTQGFLTIDYKEPDQSTYKGIKVRYTNISTMEEENYFFNTGDFFIDYLLFKKSIPKGCYGVNFSSSFDHFFMDGDNYKVFYVDDLAAKMYKKVNWRELKDLHSYYCSREQYDNWDSLEDAVKYWKENKPESFKQFKVQ